MKIIYVANSRFPSEKAQSDQVMAMCRSFAALGSDVTLFVPDRKPVQADDPFLYYAVKPTFVFQRLWCLDALRIKWLGRVGLWIQTATFLLSLRKELHRLRPNVVFSRELYVFAIPGLPGCRVWESHAPHRSSIAKYLMRRLDGIVTLTAANKRRLIGMGVRDDRVMVEPDAVDERLFQNMPSRITAREQLGISPQETLCLYMGKFTTMGQPKGLDESITAITALREKGVPVSLLAVGGTADELSLYQRQAREGIRLIGHQPKDALKTYYAAADIVLMPFPYSEHYAHYMSPLKMFEYMFSGKPIIASDLPSVREILNEQNAYFCKPGDVDSLRSAIVTVIRNPSEAREKAERARSDSTEYTWTKRAKRITDFLERL